MSAMGAEVAVVGFFRWGGRAGLPGFLAVARLDVPGLRRRVNHSEGQIHPASTLALPTLDAAGLRDHALGLLDGDDGTLSVPLIALLHAVVRWSDARPADVTRFLVAHA